MSKINPFELTFAELIFYFRQLELEDFVEFQTALYSGALELYYEQQSCDVLEVL